MCEGVLVYLAYPVGSRRSMPLLEACLLTSRDGKEKGKYCVCPVADSLCLFNRRNKVSQMVMVIHDMAKQEMIVKHLKFESEGAESSSISWSVVIVASRPFWKNRTVRGYHIGNVVRLFKTKNEVRC